MATSWMARNSRWPWQVRRTRAAAAAAHTQQGVLPATTTASMAATTVVVTGRARCVAPRASSCTSRGPHHHRLGPHRHLCHQVSVVLPPRSDWTSGSLQPSTMQPLQTVDLLWPWHPWMPCALLQALQERLRGCTCCIAVLLHTCSMLLVSRLVTEGLPQLTSRHLEVPALLGGQRQVGHHHLYWSVTV